MKSLLFAALACLVGSVCHAASSSEANRGVSIAEFSKHGQNGYAVIDSGQRILHLCLATGDSLHCQDTPTEAGTVAPDISGSGFLLMDKTRQVSACSVVGYPPSATVSCAAQSSSYFAPRVLGVGIGAESLLIKLGLDRGVDCLYGNGGLKCSAVRPFSRNLTGATVVGDFWGDGQHHLIRRLPSGDYQVCMANGSCRIAPELIELAHADYIYAGKYSRNYGASMIIGVSKQNVSACTASGAGGEFRCVSVQADYGGAVPYFHPGIRSGDSDKVLIERVDERGGRVVALAGHSMRLLISRSVDASKGIESAASNGDSVIVMDPWGDYTGGYANMFSFDLVGQDGRPPEPCPYPDGCRRGIWSDVYDDYFFNPNEQPSQTSCISSCDINYNTATDTCEGMAFSVFMGGLGFTGGLMLGASISGPGVIGIGLGGLATSATVGAAALGGCRSAASGARQGCYSVCPSR
jgi:hypothetical protein